MFIETPISDLLIYTPQIFRDKRGYFFESFNDRPFIERGLVHRFVQDNRSRSSLGTLRGLHFQKGTSAQAKLVSVLRGKVFDVAVDLRPDSQTFKQWYGIILQDSDPRSLFIPRGFAHGFVALEDATDFFYKVDNYYDKSAEGGILFSDPDLSIDWRFPNNKMLVSDKDLKLPTLSKIITERSLI